MNRKRNKNLKLNIEQKTRAKYVKSTHEALKRLATDRSAAIESLNTREPMALMRALGFEGNGAELLNCAEHLRGEDGWLKAVKYQEQCLAQFLRAQLRLEAILERDTDATIEDVIDASEEEE